MIDVWVEARKIDNDLIRKIDDALMERGVNTHDIYKSVDGFGRDFLCIEIHWGDWKHDHLRAKWIVENELGLDVMMWETYVTDSDCDDTYSARHEVWLNEEV